MASEINQDPDAAIQFASHAHTTDESKSMKVITIEAKDNTPKGRVIDDSVRGTMFWEVEANVAEGNDEGESMHGKAETVSNKDAEDVDEEIQTSGRPFHLEWLSTVRLPFYRTRGLRNPWNSNREVKIARDGTELEPSVALRLLGLLNHNSNTISAARFVDDPRGNFFLIKQLNSLETKFEQVLRKYAEATRDLLSNCIDFCRISIARGSPVDMTCETSALFHSFIIKQCILMCCRGLSGALLFLFW